MKKIYKLTFLIVMIALISVIFNATLSYEKDVTEIIFFAAQKGDSILIKSKDKSILIDTGLKEDREILADKLRQKKIRKIDYLILTHPDKDHIGGASHIINNFQVENLIQSEYRKNNKAELRIDKAISNKDINNVILREDLTLTLNNLEVEIYASKKDKSKKANDYSLVTLIKDRDLNYLFAGDAEALLLDELVNKDLPEIDVYKVAHHGRFNENTEAFIKKINPKVSIVTNEETEDKTLNALEEINSIVYNVFREDLVISTDGKEIKVK